MSTPAFKRAYISYFIGDSTLKAYIVTHTEPGSDIERILESIRNTEGVNDACRVVGRAEIVISVEGNDLRHISDIICQKVCAVRGISATETLVCVESGNVREPSEEPSTSSASEQYPTPTIAFS